MQSKVTNCGIALKDYFGDRGMNELSFTYGSLVSNIKDKTKDWSMGDHRGDRQKYFKRSHVRLLTKDELAFVNDLRRLHSEAPCTGSSSSSSSDSDSEDLVECGQHTLDLCLREDYKVELEETGLNGSTTITIRPMNPTTQHYPSYKLSCTSLAVSAPCVCVCVCVCACVRAMRKGERFTCPSQVTGA